MSQAEKYSWLSLVTTGAIFLFFKMRMMAGWQVADVSARHMFITYGLVIGLFIVAETVIAAFTAIRGGTNDIEKDERDLTIERRAEQHSSWFFFAVINILIFKLLVDQVIDGYEFMRLDLTHTPTIFFVLFSVLMVASLIQRISTIVLYRLQRARG